ncbi:MAG TPA: polyprenyl synthetase family protein [Candidatus Binataceae bacterium]|nr:polyprenyl synthetase family protein [Candidatus Binataceae bacterium]
MTSNGGPGLVSAMLREYGAITQARLREYLPAREPRRYLYDLLGDYPRRAGKMMRPALCIATARAFGARLEEALGSAVSIELLHNALLIHDDIQDGSEERRGAPTLHVLHGVPLAINAGDTLTLLSLRPLMENREVIGAQLAIRIIEETERMALESAEGQAMEIGWRQENVTDLGETDYLEMVLKKTCWLATIHPSRVGALIGSRGALDPELFMRFGFFLGAAFQIQDDLLNLVGDPQRYGKERDGDIREGKRTIMLIRLFHEATAQERARLGTVFGGPRERRTDADVRWVRELMDRYGCIEYARRIAQGLAGAALHEYSLLYRGLPSSRDKRFIEEMATWVIERT